MKRLLFISVILSVLIGCESKVIEPERVVFEEGICFEKEIQIVFDSYCISCHTTGNAAGGLDLSEGNSYIDILSDELTDTANPDQSELYVKLMSNHYDNASFDDYNLILGWIQQGAEETTCN